MAQWLCVHPTTWTVSNGKKKLSWSRASCSSGICQAWIYQLRLVCEGHKESYMGTHGLLRLFSPPSISNTLRFLSRAASRPATTHPQEPPAEAVSPYTCPAMDRADLTSGHDNVHLIWDRHDGCQCSTILLEIPMDCPHSFCGKEGQESGAFICDSRAWRSPTFGHMGLWRNERLA